MITIIRMVHNHRDVQGGTARAAVFGISDGLVSNAALILGVAAANLSGDTVFLSGPFGTSCRSYFNGRW